MAKKNKYTLEADSLANDLNDLQATEKKEQLNEKKFFTFSFNLEQQAVEFLREFVLYKRKSDSLFFHFNNSQAIREGILLLKANNPSIEARPEHLKIPTRVGREGSLNGAVKLKTSYFINEVERDFIYNFIYEKSLQNVYYSKTDFMNDLIGAIKNEYPKMKKGN
jgi:hypothetical protein